MTSFFYFNLSTYEVFYFQMFSIITLKDTGKLIEGLSAAKAFHVTNKNHINISHLGYYKLTTQTTFF